MTTVGRFRHTDSLLIIVSTGMSQINAVIFDIDGTLLISNEAHAQAYIEAASILGINADFTQIRSLIGKGGDKLIPEAFGFETRYLPGLQPAPGTRPLLSRLHIDGVRLAVATSGIRRVPTHSLNVLE
jgi:phosphoglycolate phosphatase-like HAD superfamily hydrolase